MKNSRFLRACRSRSRSARRIVMVRGMIWKVFFPLFRRPDPMLFFSFTPDLPSCRYIAQHAIYRARAGGRTFRLGGQVSARGKRKGKERGAPTSRGQFSLNVELYFFFFFFIVASSFRSSRWGGRYIVKERGNARLYCVGVDCYDSLTDCI